MPCNKTSRSLVSTARVRVLPRQIHPQLTRSRWPFLACWTPWPIRIVSSSSLFRVASSHSVRTVCPPVLASSRASCRLRASRAPLPRSSAPSSLRASSSDGDDDDACSPKRRHFLSFGETSSRFCSRDVPLRGGRLSSPKRPPRHSPRVARSPPRRCLHTTAHLQLGGRETKSALSTRFASSSETDDDLMVVDETIVVPKISNIPIDDVVS